MGGTNHPWHLGVLCRARHLPARDTCDRRLTRRPRHEPDDRPKSRTPGPGGRSSAGPGRLDCRRTQALCRCSGRLAHLLSAPPGLGGGGRPGLCPAHPVGRARRPVPDYRCRPRLSRTQRPNGAVKPWRAEGRRAGSQRTQTRPAAEKKSGRTQSPAAGWVEPGERAGGRRFRVGSAGAVRPARGRS